MPLSLKLKIMKRPQKTMDDSFVNFAPRGN